MFYIVDMYHEKCVKQFTLIRTELNTFIVIIKQDIQFTCSLILVIIFSKFKKKHYCLKIILNVKPNFNF